MKKLFVLFTLAGCAKAVPVIPTPAQDTCNASAYENVIGQDATALEKVLILGKVRVIRPNDAVTMDFHADRINFQIDPDARIKAISCG